MNSKRSEPSGVKDIVITVLLALGFIGTGVIGLAILAGLLYIGYTLAGKPGVLALLVISALATIWFMIFLLSNDKKERNDDDDDE